MHPFDARTGVGTTAQRVAPGRRADATAVPELCCPGPVRDNKALGDEVNNRPVDWAQEIGLYADRLDQLRATNFGRLFMLVHPDTDDPDRLLMAAKCAAAQWSVDDHYCDDESAGSVPALLGPRLAVAMTAVDPAHLPVRYAPELERTMREDPTANN